MNIQEQERDSMDELEDGIDSSINTASDLTRRGMDLHNRQQKPSGQGQDTQTSHKPASPDTGEGEEGGMDADDPGGGQTGAGDQHKPRGDDPNVPKPKELDIKGGAAQENLNNASSAAGSGANAANAANTSATPAGATSAGATAGGTAGSSAAGAAAGSAAGAGATTAGTAAGSAAGGAGGATAGAAAGTAVTPGVGTAIGAFAGAAAAPVLVQVIKIIVKLLIIAVVFCSLLSGYFKSIPGMVFEESTLLVDAGVLEDYYTGQRQVVTDKYQLEYDNTADAADAEAEERAEEYEDDYDGVTYSIEFSASAAELIAVFEDSINLIFSLYDVKLDDWKTGSIEHLIGTDWWADLWAGFIVYEFTDEDHEVTRDGDEKYLHITFYVDIYDLGFPHIVDAFDVTDAQLGEALEMASNASDLFGTGFGFWDSGNAWGDPNYGGSVSGGNTHAAIKAAIDALEEDFPAHGSPVYPLPSAAVDITSYYGPRNFAPDPNHTGVDFSAGVNTPIVASMDGIVLLVRNTGSKGFGKHIVLYHGSGISTMYGHMNKFANLKVGDQVVAGETVIGYVGKTGLSTGYHLHFEYQINGAPKNPLNYLNLPN